MDAEVTAALQRMALWERASARPDAACRADLPLQLRDTDGAVNDLPADHVVSAARHAKNETHAPQDLTACSAIAYLIFVPAGRSAPR